MTAPSRLWVVRHGQTAWNLEGRFQGHADQPLNAAGLQQARDLAPQLTGLGCVALYSSDLVRAATTASVLGEALGMPVRRHAGLREIDQGLWEGLGVDEIRARFSTEWQARSTDPLAARPPGGESLAEMAARVWAAADDIARAHPGAQVLVVSHGLSLAAIICRARGLPLARAFDHIPDNCRPEALDWMPGSA